MLLAGGRGGGGATRGLGHVRGWRAALCVRQRPGRGSANSQCRLAARPQRGSPLRRAERAGASTPGAPPHPAQAEGCRKPWMSQRASPWACAACLLPGSRPALKLESAANSVTFQL